MKPIDTLIKYIGEKNIADIVEDEQKVQIVQDVIQGYKVDEESRGAWLDTNKEAMNIIKHCESDDMGTDHDDPIYKNAKVIYPLLAQSVISLASRIIQHIVRNDKVVEVAVLGESPEVPDPQVQQQVQQQVQMGQIDPQQAQQMIPMIKPKELRAQRVEKFLNYELLIESDTWLKDTHKLCHIIASWGTAFRQVYYDYVTNKNCDDLISPEDVIINHNITCLDKAPRITVKHYMRGNDILEQMNAGYFSEIDIDTISSYSDQQEISETNPTHTILCQITYIDLDGDGYAEPYKVYVHEAMQKLLCIVPAFDVSDIKTDEKGKIIRIQRRLDIVDYHLIDDPEGKFYSIGLNYLLLHQNKSITAILRQLLDAGALANAASCTGFITNAFKTKERHLDFTLGSYKSIDVNPNVDPRQHVIPLPAREPSQVLMGLLQMLIESGEKTGFITDVLTGDMAGQNVPATTMLAMIEQGTRAFKPVIQKFWSSTKKQCKLWAYLHSKHLENERYINFHDSQMMISRDDFNLDDFDICPVADPTQSSESHKYAKLQAIVQLLGTQAINVMNVQENLVEFYKGLEFDNPERFVMQPQPPEPDAQMIKAQLEAQMQPIKIELEKMKLQLEEAKIANERMKIQLNAKEVAIKADESLEKQRKMVADATRSEEEAKIKGRLANVAEDKVEVEKRRVELMKRDKGE